MKKSYLKLVFLDILLFIVLLLNTFKFHFLNYYMLVFLLGFSLIVFKMFFGIEKDNHRYIKDIILNILIIFLISFLIYYLFGLIIGFVRTQNYYTLHGFKTFIIPYIMYIILKEYLRYQMLKKSEGCKLLTVLSCVLFIFLDITNNIDYYNWTSGYNVFMFFSLFLLPAISSNLVCTYITKKIGYKPNILWLLIFNLYGVLLPIIPNTGIYVGSMIKFLFPIIIVYNVYLFFLDKNKDTPVRINKKFDYLVSLGLFTFVALIMSLTSGAFSFYPMAIASNSMAPNIYKGDVVIVNKKYDVSKLKVGEILVYEYNSSVIVHRIVNIEKVDNEYYIYTQGDANNTIDNYIVYEEMILGVVNNKISYIGYPTIWLNEL